MAADDPNILIKGWLMGKKDSSAVAIDVEFSSSGTLTVNIKGKLTRYEVPLVYRKLKKKLTSLKPDRVHVGLSDLSTVDTAGVALLVALCREARAKGMDFELKQPSEHCLRVIKLARLENLLLRNQAAD